MLLERLVLKNFKRFKDQEILFRDGITGIIGNNGSGKSSIVEAILFSLYGLSGTGMQPEFIVSSFAGSRERCEVRLDFQIRGRAYSVVRQFRKGTTTQHDAKLFIDTKLLAQGVSEVEREMVRLTGMDARDFKNTIYAGQRDLSILLENRPGERRQWFTRALGLDDIKDRSQVILKERIDALERNGDLLQGELQGLKNVMDSEAVRTAQGNIDELRLLVASYTTTLDHLVNERTLLQEDLNSLVEHQYLYLRLRERLETGEKNLVHLQQRKASLRDQVENLLLEREKFEALSAAHDTYLNERNKLEKEREKKRRHDQLTQEKRFVELQIAHIDEQITQVKQKLQQVQHLEQEKSILNVRIREGAQCPGSIPDDDLESYVRTSRDHLTEQIGAFHEALEDAVRKREELLIGRDTLKAEGSEGKCPLCHQRLGDHYHHITAEYEEQMVILVKGAEDTCSQLERLEAERESLISYLPLIDDIHRIDERLKDRYALYAEMERLDQQRNSYEAQCFRFLQELQQLSFNDTEFTDLEQKVRDLEQLHEKHENLGKRIAPLSFLEQQVAIVIHDIEEQERDNGVLNQELRALTFDPDSVLHLQGTLALLQDRITAMERDRARDGERLKKTEEIITRYNVIKRRINEISQNLAGSEEEARLLRLTRTIITDFVVYLMQVVRSEIEFYAGTILSEITGNRYNQVLLDSDFTIRVNDLDDDYPIERFSGGEQDDIAVALRIALSRYLAELHQIHDSTFLIFDEIFGSQDEERRNNLLRALRTQESYFPQIILISHISDIQGEFAGTLMVEIGSDMVSSVREVS